MTRPAEKRFDLVGTFDALALAGKKPDVDRSSLDLVDRLGALTLDGAKPHADTRSPLRNCIFAGFRHNVILDDPNANRHIPQQSRTMQFARKFLMPDIPARPTLAPPIGGIYPSALLDSIVYPEATTTPPLAAVNAPTQPTIAVAQRPRSVSAPFPGKLGTAQCSGETKAHNQCSRQVKLPATYSHLDPIPKLYCYQHKVPTVSQPSVYIRKPGSWDKFVEFSHYIPKYLQKDTQVALKLEMEKRTSTADVPGFIYTFEIRDEKRSDVIQLKVGRTINLNKRFNEWDKQCGSKVQIPRGWWPGTDDDGSLLKGNIRGGDPGPFCHRLERLVHIELADLSMHAPYLNPEWPDTLPEDSPQKRAVKEERCRDCGLVHKEIFTFLRPRDGEYKGKEWELIVKPVIEKWGRFVKEYYV